MSSFDEIAEITLSEDDDVRKDFKPLHTINLKNNDDVLKWLNSEFKYLLKLNNPRHNNIIENLLLYQGVLYSPNDKKTLNDFLDTSSVNTDTRRQRLTVNHLYDITETIVSRSTMQRPEPEVLPANSNEIHDRNAATAVSHILKYIAYINDLNQKDIDFKRISMLGGQGFMTCLWNKDKGDIHPSYLEAKENGFKDEDGKPLKDSNGRLINDDNIIKTGEVDVKIVPPWRVLLDEKETFEEVDYCFTVEVDNVENIKTDYPKSKDKIKSMDTQRIFDTNRMIFRKLRNETYKIKFYHKKTKYLPQGFEAVFTFETILEKGRFAYSHDSLPLVRLTDIDIPSSLHGMSFYEMTKNIQYRHNQLSSDIITSQRLCAKPKWIVPKGRVKLESLGNDITIVQYSGNIKPELVSTNPTPPEIFAFREKLKEELGQIATVTPIARRDVPKQIHASVAMSFLTELENVRASTSVSKHNEAIRQLYVMMMSVASTYYDISDGRTMRVLGNDEEFLIKDIQISNLSKPYDVLIKNAASLPEMRATRDARLFDTLNVRPDLLSDSQLIDTLELGSTKKITTIVTESLRAAESENEKFFQEDETVMEPTPNEDSIVHWKTHVQKSQSQMVKENASPESKTALEEHIWGTEFLMYEKAKINKLFEAELANLKLFPIYYREGQGFTPSSIEQQKAVAQGQANRGEGQTEQIAGSESDLDKEKTEISRNINQDGK